MLLKKIAKVPKDNKDKPLEDVKIIKASISEVMVEK